MVDPTAGIDFAQAFQPLVDSLLGAVTDILPLALTVFGAVYAIRLGKRLFTSLTGR